MIGHVAAVHEGTRYRIKDRVKAAIYEEVCTVPESSRKSIAERRALRPNTVSSAVQELIDDALIREGANRHRGKSGRPEVFVEPLCDRLTALSLYVRSRELEGVLVNLGDQVLAETQRYIPEQSSEEQILQLVIDMIQDLRERVPAASELLGAGISLVGTVVPERKLWRYVARWPKVHMLDFHEVQRRTQLPVSLRRIHDAELEYLIEHNDAYRRENIILLHWGYGIGSAYAHAGKILSSTSGEFGEIGHTVIDPSSKKRCQCGSCGCLETEAALWALLPELGRVYSGVSGDDQQIVDLLCRPRILGSAPLRKALECLTLGLVNLHRLFNPDRILFIGPFTENREMFKRLSSAFRRRLPEHTRDQVVLEVIPGGFTGCGFGNAYPFFRRRLRELLKARYS